MKTSLTLMLFDMKVTKVLNLKILCYSSCIPQVMNSFHWIDSLQMLLGPERWKIVSKRSMAGNRRTVEDRSFNNIRVTIDTDVVILFHGQVEGLGDVQENFVEAKSSNRVFKKSAQTIEYEFQNYIDGEILFPKLSGQEEFHKKVGKTLPTRK